MAKFNVGDWVEITPNPDYSWREWTDVHSDFCGAIGYIEEVFPDMMSNFEDNDRIKIVVDFKYKKYDEIHSLYYMWFLKRHVVHSSREQAEVRQRIRKQGEQLQSWEKHKRKIVDDSLRELFSPPSRRRKSVPKDVDLWDEKTDPMIPLPKSAEDEDLFDEELEDWYNNFAP